MKKDLPKSGKKARGHSGPVSFVVPAFDLFGFSNDLLGQVLEPIGPGKVFVLTQEAGEDRWTAGAAKKIKTPVFDGDILNKCLAHFLKTQNPRGLIVFLLPFFPFRTRAHIEAAISMFQTALPNFLMTMDSLGNDAEVLYITTAEHFRKKGDLFKDAGEAFIYMADEGLAARARDPQKYQELLAAGRRSPEYSIAKQKELAAEYRDNLRHYDREFLEGQEITDPVALRSSRDAPQRISRLVELKKGPRILDVGCSSGNVTIRYARQAPDTAVVGVDIDEELIKTAQAYLEKEPEALRQRVKFVCAPMENFQEAPKSFDTIMATEFFEHILHTQHDSIMRQCLRFLKPNGHLIASVPNRFVKDVYFLQRRYRWDWTNHYTHFTKKSLEFFLEKYFKKVEFYSIYDEKPEEGVFLIAEGIGKK